MRVILIRHGATVGNLARRYIGCTDEPLAPDAQPLRGYPTAECVYSSPMRRCVQTAHLIYPAVPPVFLSDLRECDFGAFENHTYEDLKDNPDYRAWIDDQTGTFAPPDGENTAAFRERCCRAFAGAIEESLKENRKSAAFMIHGGTIMAVMERFAAPEFRRFFYEWQPENWGGWIAKTDSIRWQEGKVLTDIEKLTAGGDLCV